MKVRGATALVTGGAHGIGRALCERLHADGAAHVVVLDRDIAAAAAVAEKIGGVAVCRDVTDADAVAETVARMQALLGPIDLLCSNAGLLERDPEFATRRVAGS